MAKKPIALWLPELEAVVLRAILGPLSHESARRSIASEMVYHNALKALDSDSSKRLIFDLFTRIHLAFERLGLAR